MSRQSITELFDRARLVAKGGRVYAFEEEYPDEGAIRLSPLEVLELCQTNSERDQREAEERATALRQAVDRLTRHLASHKECPPECGQVCQRRECSEEARAEYWRLWAMRAEGDMHS